MAEDYGYVHLPGPQIHPRPQANAQNAQRAHRENRGIQRREGRWGVGATAPYPLQLRGCHRDRRPHPAARPGGVRKHKKGRSRQLRPIHHRRMKTIKKDECSYSVSNAIRTLAMVRPKGLEPPAFRTGI